jgi:hypothetical protein
MREWILRSGRRQQGEPTDKQAKKLTAIEDLGRLERIADKVHSAKSWNGLLRVQ